MGKVTPVKEAKEKIPQLLALLDESYPDATCSLDYEDPLQLLISTQLAAQCTDARVNQVTPALYARYPDCKAFAEAEQAELEDLIRSTGFFRNKAKNIIACCRAILERHGGKVPDTMEELTALAGVGRKTANLVLGDAFGKPAIVVDTHAIRLTNRIGLTNSKDPGKIEEELRAILPPEKSNRFCHQLVLHGRAVCQARKPQCELCTLRSLCRFAGGNE